MILWLRFHLYVAKKKKTSKRAYQTRKLNKMKSNSDHLIIRNHHLGGIHVFIRRKLYFESSKSDYRQMYTETQPWL